MLFMFYIITALKLQMKYVTDSIDASSPALLSLAHSLVPELFYGLP